MIILPISPMVPSYFFHDLVFSKAILIALSIQHDSWDFVRFEITYPLQNKGLDLGRESCDILKAFNMFIQSHFLTVPQI